MGAHHKEESRVEDDGLWAALYGVNKIASGSADVGLIIAYAKPSESDVSKFYSTLADPFCQRPVGLNEVTASGLLARRYAVEHGLADDAFAKVVASAWERARANEFVSPEAAPSIDEIMASPEVASPLRQLMMARPVDGAVAIVLASEKFARRVTPSPVWVTGMGAAMDGNVFAMRNNTFDACAAAARMAYTKAGVTPASFSFAELSATSAVAELMTVEALGLAEPGRGLDACLGDGIPINPSGGALPANPIMATGLVRLAEAAERLWASGESAGRGGSAGSSALVHASSGLGAQSHCVFVVEV